MEKGKQVVDCITLVSMAEKEMSKCSRPLPPSWEETERKKNDTVRYKRWKSQIVQEVFLNLLSVLDQLVTGSKLNFDMLCLAAACSIRHPQEEATTFRTAGTSHGGLLRYWVCYANIVRNNLHGQIGKFDTLLVRPGCFVRSLLSWTNDTRKRTKHDIRMNI